MIISWLRFEWDLKQVPEGQSATAPFILRRAEHGEDDAVRQMAGSSFSTDTGWSDIQTMFAQHIARSVQAAFEKTPDQCLLLLHGNRIIGASILVPDTHAESHLSIGPCILHEYRGRGLGTLLLKASLLALRESGLDRAWGVARDKTTASRYVYPKFGGIATPWTPDFTIVPRIAA